MTVVSVIDVARPGTAEALVDLQRAAYAVEAALIGHDGIPQLTETPDELRAAGLHWLAVLEAGRPVAALAYSLACSLPDAPEPAPAEPRTVAVVDIERLVVHPERFRTGLARALLAAVPQAEVTEVATGRDNGPARRLYSTAGFHPVEDVEVAPGLWITRLRRDAGRPG